MNEFERLGIVGSAGSGKDLVSDWFVDRGFVKISFADFAKRFLSKAFGLTEFQLWGESSKRDEEFEVNDNWWSNAALRLTTSLKEILEDVLAPGKRSEGILKLLDWFSGLRRDYPTRISSRVMLQTFGSDWGRQVDMDMWAEATHRTIDVLSLGGFVYTQRYGLVHNRNADSPKGVIISDHRFINEMELTRMYDGHLIKVKRLSSQDKIPPGIKGHISETEQMMVEDSNFDLILELPEGIENVHSILDEVYKDKAWKKNRLP